MEMLQQDLQGHVASSAWKAMEIKQGMLRWALLKDQWWLQVGKTLP